MTSWWYNRKVVVTGQTGFKGTWLCLWLEMHGAKVTALGLPPETAPNLYELASPWKAQDHHFADIRDSSAVEKIFAKAKPEIVFHMAAQSLVRRSYKNPVDTFSTNVMGTINILEAIRKTDSVRAAVMITTDKVYENNDEGRAFVETDRLGGHDPYSNSKACMELAVQSWRDSFFKDANAPAIATARAGNVIGGGDWAEDRLIPDIVRALDARKNINIRNPQSVRPWQHVLDPLNGYMMLAKALIDNPGTGCAFNFGPDPEAFMTVGEIVEHFSTAFGHDLSRESEEAQQPHEARLLTLDTQLAKAVLNWHPRLDIHDTIGWTAAWYKKWLEGEDARKLALAQINDFEQFAKQEHAP